MLLTTLGAIALLLAISAFFSGSETALTAVSRGRMHQLEKDGSRAARNVNGAQQLGWYADALYQYETAALWFGTALGFDPNDEPSAYGLALIPFVTVLFLSGIALGVFGAAIVLRLGPASEWLIWPIPSMLSPFVGVFYPLSVLPGWMQTIGRFLAPSYIFEGMRAVVAGKGAPYGLLAEGCLLAVIYLVLAGLTFTLVYRHAIRTGLIARYSAESVG